MPELGRRLERGLEGLDVLEGLVGPVEARIADRTLTDEVARLIGDGCGVADVASTVGLSERQLRRRSLAAFGYGPKHLGRVLRLQRALRLARGGQGMATTAAGAGYADQAHMTRDFTLLTGLAPRSLVAGAR